jgi:hypothetical protein
VLTRLGDALGAWSPRTGGGDPLTVIRAAWSRLVGNDVARAAQPVALANDALVVITSSSSWSHQLAFLEPQILRGIRDLVPSGTIVRLRFRVGTIRGKPGGRRPSERGISRGRVGVSSLAAPADPQEALARFRAVVMRSRAAHAARGGRFCATCAAPIARGEHCVPCGDWARAALEARCQRLLFDAPWLRPQDVLDALPELDAAAYDVIRRRLLRSWWDEMALARKRATLPRPVAPDRARLRKIASSYVLLETKLHPNRLEMDSPVRRNALGELYEFILAVERGDGDRAGLSGPAGIAAPRRSGPAHQAGRTGREAANESRGEPPGSNAAERIRPKWR